MASPRGVLLVSEDRALEDAVAKALEGHDQLALAGVCRSVANVADSLGALTVSGVVVDLEPQPEQTLAKLDSLTPGFPGICFVVLADSAGQDLIVRAMEAGARYFLLKESVEDKLASVLEKLILSAVPAAAGEEGRIISIFSAGGGCGATTLAVNLANELTLLTSKAVLLVDMDCAYGSVAAYLGLEGQHGLADVLNREGIIDTELVQSCALTHSKELHALLSPVSTDLALASEVGYERLDEALATFISAYAFTVIDAPRIPINVAARLARASASALLVLEQNVMHVRMAKAMLNKFAQLGAQSNRIIPTVTRYRKGTCTISFDQCKTALGHVAIEVVSDDYPSAIRAINYGQPLAKVAPRSLLRKEVCNLARKMANEKRTNRK